MSIFYKKKSMLDPSRMVGVYYQKKDGNIYKLNRVYYQKKDGTNWLVYSGRYSARVIIKWYTNYSTKKVWVTNPAWTVWSNGRRPYEKAVSDAKKDLEIWLRSNPEPEEPSKDRITQDWYLWSSKMRGWNQALNQRKRELNSWDSSNPEPVEPPKTLENPEWTTWNIEMQKRQSALDAKQKEVNSWWAQKPSETIEVPNPEWDRWRSDRDVVDAAYDAYKSYNTNTYEPTSAEWDRLYNKWQETGDEADRQAWRDYNDNVYEPVVAERDRLLQKYNVIYDDYRRKWPNGEPPKTISKPNPDYPAWESTWNRIVAERNSLRDERDAWKRQEPTKTIPNPEYDVWVTEHAAWASARQPYLDAVAEAQAKVDEWAAQEPEKYEHNPDWDVWVTEHAAWVETKNTYDNAISSAESDLADYDRTEPAKQIQVEVPIYGYSASARLDPAPLSGQSSNDTVSVRLHWGGSISDINITLSISNLSGYGTTNYEEEQFTTASVTCSNWERTYTEPYTYDNTDWKSGYFDFRENN